MVQNQLLFLAFLLTTTAVLLLVEFVSVETAPALGPWFKINNLTFSRPIPRGVCDKTLIIHVCIVES